LGLGGPLAASSSHVDSQEKNINARKSFALFEFREVPETSKIQETGVSYFAEL
jgi:hypothetical protein